MWFNENQTLNQPKDILAVKSLVPMLKKSQMRSLSGAPRLETESFPYPNDQEVKFTPLVPDNTPVGARVAITNAKSQPTQTEKSDVRLYRLVKEGENVYWEQLKPNPADLILIGREVTGDGLGVYEVPVRLSTIKVGDRLEAKKQGQPNYQLIDQGQIKYKDIFKVAILLP